MYAMSPTNHFICNKYFYIATRGCVYRGFLCLQPITDIDILKKLMLIVYFVFKIIVLMTVLKAFLFRIPSKYPLERVNCNMFSNISLPGAISP